MASRKPLVLINGQVAQLQEGDTIEGIIATSTDLHFTYVHAEPGPGKNWTIVHNLGKKPSVTVVDDNDNVMSADVRYIDEHALVVMFSSPTSGKAYLN